MDPDHGIAIGISHTQDGRRSAPGGLARVIDPPCVIGVVLHDLAGDAGEQRGLTSVETLVRRFVPVPALLSVGRLRLDGIGDEAAMLLRQSVHSRS